ncbi:MAG TPA: capsular biosynthesis protein [Thermoanaerobaculia bacterium]|nr:capsular biosynthesis protein [Thermoanaerobaculia bacterium]HUM30822.1 capsular biosynthesis protein [Thermoanaerobaculia bacterium]HXK69157.1 capsular biosynthesis protein [Thermoanaerobaculia bacterium]
MIDLHCHILPGVDDGASSWKESLSMALMAEDDGIEAIFATPHANPSYHNVSAGTVDQLVQELNTAIQKEGRTIQVYTGHDAHLVPELLDRLRSGEIHTLNSSRYFLLEPPEHFRISEMQEAIFGFMAHGFVPIITHPERVGAFLRNPEFLYRLVEQGALVQITAGSVTGYFGESIRHYSESILKEGLGHILASDAHSPRHRPPILSQACNVISSWGVDAHPMVSGRPRAVLSDEEIDIPSPAKPSRPGLFQRLFKRM